MILKNVFLKIEANPDIMNLDRLAKMKAYNILCSVPEGYNNMQQLYELNQMYHNLHFCGGNFLYLNKNSIKELAIPEVELISYGFMFSNNSLVNLIISLF